MLKKDNPKLKKISVVYVDNGKYNLLKSQLALKGVSVSSWFREKVDQFLKNHKLT